MTLEKNIHQQFVIPVIREKDEETLYSVCMALRDGGMKILEVTLMSDSALKVIQRLSKVEGLIIGAGTVLNSSQAKQSLEAGAKFLVSPGLDEASVIYARSCNTLFIPGVMTPSEVMQAKQLGCNLVKVFPVTSLGGVNYINNLKGPFPDMNWMATGGIQPVDALHYHAAGISAVGIGGHLTPKEKIQKKEWKGISEIAKALMETIPKGS